MAAAAAAASNVFANMLQRNNTPKMAIVLIYTLLEWTLIALLLLHGVFSYSIVSFAGFFGLDPPCFLCSHASVADLGFCDRHRNLARSEHVRGDCSPSLAEKKSEERSILEEKSEEKSVLDEKSEEKSLFAEKSEGVDESSEEKLVLDEISEEKLVLDEISEEKMVLDEISEEKLVLDEESEEKMVIEDASVEFLPGIHFEVVERLFPVELIDSLTLFHSGIDGDENEDFGEFQVACDDEDGKVIDVEANCVVSIGSEICDHDQPLLDFVQCSERLAVEVNEEREPETPTSIDSFCSPLQHKRLREFGTESLDGISVGSDLDASELLTVDHLKAVLKAERKALSALYSELEEERSASSVAANETMAMITRLQEEKAAMQMEAFQYQRMMEEQSEYDQEALQLLNDLVVKREREKQELVEELEAYRKERNIVPLSDDALRFTADSLVDFEDERFSILEQLKALEEKLILSDDNDESNTTNGIEHHSSENAHVNGFVNGSDTNGKFYSKPRSAISSGKSLLPLFDDVVGFESEDGSSPICNHKKLAIIEEVDNIYERLYAFEADREFIKNCIGSLRKGDKGMDLLREILQHLRDLRSVQFRVRNAGYALGSLSA